MQNVVKEICKNNNIVCNSATPATGGDINTSFIIQSQNATYFLKINSANDFPLMFQREAEGLDALRQQAYLKVPEVLAQGELDENQYLLLEYINPATQDESFWETFALGLAALHRISNNFFGWHSSNYIGSLVQRNEWMENWSSFYSKQHLMLLVESLFNKTLLNKNDLKAAEKVCLSLDEIFPEEPPSLLHGDLWSGNFMAVHTTSKAVVAAIYDPAVYFGHREMDIGMSLLFGGFSSRFYDAYNSIFPLENGWRKRVLLTQLYPLLVHAVLFGGGYITQCRSILKNWGS